MCVPQIASCATIPASSWRHASYQAAPLDWRATRRSAAGRIPRRRGSGFNFTNTDANVCAGAVLDDVSINIDSVPEPASWALLIAGFGLPGDARQTGRPELARMGAVTGAPSPVGFRKRGADRLIRPLFVQAATTRRRRTAPPTRPKPDIIIDHVPGSGAAATCPRISPPGKLVVCMLA